MKDSLYPSVNGRMTWPFFLLAFFFLQLSSISSLQAQRKCAAMDYLDDQLKSYPHMRRQMHQIESQAAYKSKGITGEITIPVVIHVVYHSPDQNISDAQVRSQIEVLKQDFRRRNPDRSLTPAEWKDVAADTRINFQLAQVDPKGNPTTGITRYRSDKAVFYAGENSVKYASMGGVDAWPTQHYLNIWVCPLGSGVLGYAQFPGGGARETDGVVISYRHFGTLGTVSPPFDRGRTTTHEVGHWLNLRHIWGDGGCELDDHVADTPPADRPHHGCVDYAESCSGPNMVQNFMDYTDDACMNLFTQGQAQRMRALFAPGGYRYEMLSSPALKPTVPVSPPTPPVVKLDPPTRIELLTTGERFARFRWEEVGEAEAYYVRLRPQGSPSWIGRGFRRPYVNPSQLQSCTDYEFQVATVARGDTSRFSNTISFSTLGCTPVAVEELLDPSKKPQNLQAAPRNGGQALLRWDAIPGATEYKLQFKRIGNRQVTTQYLKDNNMYMKGLKSGGNYLFRVRAHFPEGPGPYSEVASFTYGAMAMHTAAYRSAGGQIKARYYADQRTLWVRLPIEEEQELDLKLWGSEGTTLIHSFPRQQAIPGKSLPLTTPVLRPGSYVIEMKDKDGFVYRERVELE